MLEEADNGGALAQLELQLLRLLAPQSLNPADSQNAVQELERSYQDGLAELERAGYDGRGVSLLQYVHRLEALERRSVR